MIPKMFESGWQPAFSPNDVERKSIIPTYVPRDDVKFIKKLSTVVAWKGMNFVNPNIEPKTWGWIVADIVDNHYQDHRFYLTLNDILENEK